MTLRGEAMAAALDKAINLRQNIYFSKYANRAEIIQATKAFYDATQTPPNTNISKPDALASLSDVIQNEMSDLLTAYAVGNVPAVVSTTSSHVQTSGTFPDMNQDITNNGFTFRTPSYEAKAQGLRAQIGLMDQQYAQFLAKQNFPYLDQVFTNELNSIDLDIKRLQIAYLNTIVMSPINGVVTGIYKNSGDWTQAGEPVIRVEDNSRVILVGTLACQGPISIGQLMTVNTSLFDSSGSPAITGAVISVRGRPNEDDVWDVHAICDNSAVPVLPLNYHFDYDDTSVTFSP
jgi:hypothetical protein